MHLLALLAALAAAAPLHRTLSTSTGERHYLLLKPSGEGPLPLVLVLHGHGGSAKQALSAGPLAAWTAISARERVMVAALDGLKGGDGKQGWNDCRAIDNGPGDDVAFAAAVVGQLVREEGADARRVY